jgi:hypothetical protein
MIRTVLALAFFVAWSPANSQPQAITLAVPDTALIYATVSPQPLIRFGENARASVYRLGSSAWPMLRPADTIVVAVPSAGEVRIFNSAGEFLRRVGTAADGGASSFPAQLIHLPSGAIGVYDERSKTLKHYANYDAPFRTDSLALKSVTPIASPHSFKALLPDGSWLMAGSKIVGPSKLNRFVDGIRVDSIILYHSSADRTSSRVIGRFLASRVYQTWLAAENLMLMDGTFEARTGVVVHDGRVLVADLGGGRITVLDTSGARLAEYTLPAGTPLTDELKDRIIAQRATTTSRGWVALPGKPSPPDSIPFAGEFRRDALGMMWLGSFAPDKSDAGSSRWFVYGSDGVYRGTVVLPAGLIVREITANRILGTLSPQAGTQVVLYGLQRHLP